MYIFVMEIDEWFNKICADSYVIFKKFYYIHNKNKNMINCACSFYVKIKCYG